jgi:hypothetical protein
VSTSSPAKARKGRKQRARDLKESSAAAGAEEGAGAAGGKAPAEGCDGACGIGEQEQGKVLKEQEEKGEKVEGERTAEAYADRSGKLEASAHSHPHEKHQDASASASKKKQQDANASKNKQQQEKAAAPPISSPPRYMCQHTTMCCSILLFLCLVLL